MGDLTKNTPAMFWYSLGLAILLASITFSYVAIRATSFKISYEGMMVEFQKQSVAADAERLSEIAGSIAEEPEAAFMMPDEGFDGSEGIGSAIGEMGGWPEVMPPIDELDEPDLVSGGEEPVPFDPLEELDKIYAVEIGPDGKVGEIKRIPLAARRNPLHLEEELREIRDRNMAIQQNVQQSLKH